MSESIFTFGIILSEFEAIHFACSSRSIGHFCLGMLVGTDRGKEIIEGSSVQVIYPDVVQIEYVDENNDTIDPNKVGEYEVRYEDPIFILELPLPRIFHSVYNGIDDAVAKAKEMYGKYLPQGIDIKKRFAFCIGHAE